MSVYRRGSHWYISACWKWDRCRRSTDANSKAEAKRYEAMAILQMQSGVRGRDVELDGQAAQRRQQWTLKDCFERCLRESWAHLKSVESYHRPVAGSMIRQLGENRQLKDIEADDLLKLRSRTVTGAIKPATFNRYMQLLSTMMNWSVEWEKPIPKLKPLRYRLEENERFRILADSEEQPLLDGCLEVSEEYRDFVICALDMGWRSSEGCRLRPQDVRLADQEATIWDGKSGSRGVPLTERATQALKRQRQKAMQRGSKTLWTYSKDRCVDLFADAKKAAGITDKDLTAHCLRHTTATRLLEAGQDIHTVAQWLGHSNLETTRKYAKVLGHTLNKARDSLESR